MLSRKSVRVADGVVWGWNLADPSHCTAVYTVPPIKHNVLLEGDVILFMCILKSMLIIDEKRGQRGDQDLYAIR